MKILSIMLLLLLNHGFSMVYSQSPTVKWTHVYESDDPESPDAILYDNGNQLYVAVSAEKKNKKEISPGIMVLNQNMEKEKIEYYTADEEDVLFHGFTYVNGMFIMITSFKDKEEGLREVKGVVIDAVTLKIASTQMLMKIPEKRVSKTDFRILVSENKSKLMIVSFADVNRAESDKITYKVFDNALKVVNENTLTLDKPSIMTDLKSILLGNDGTALLAVKYYWDDSRKETIKNQNNERVASYEWKFVKLGLNKEIKSTVKPIGQTLSPEVKMAIDPATGEYCIAAKWMKLKDELVYGYRFVRINSESMEVAAASVYNFEPDLVKKLKNAGPKADYSKVGIDDENDITEFRILKDGRMYLVWEKNEKSRFQSGDAVYTSGHIFVQMLTSDGKPKWSHVIDKKQSSNAGPGYLFHHVMFSETAIHIFYNAKDYPVNTPFDKEGITRTLALMNINMGRNMSLVKASVSNEGKLTWNVFSNTDEMGTNVVPFMCKQTTDSHFVFFGKKYSALSQLIITGDTRIGLYVIE